MKSETRPRRRTSAAAPDDIHALYLELLHRYFERGDRRGAARTAARLESALAGDPHASVSIRGDEIRSLIAELRGEIVEAIRFREGEIRKILELHSMARDTPSWPFILRRYDFGDVGDRLDLLANLYAKSGDRERAIATLEESKQFCQSHRVPFDGQDMLDELRREPGKHTRRGPRGRMQTRSDR
jgi:hypothetical protein